MQEPGELPPPRTISQLWTITRYDLRQGLRDKSVILFGLIVPLALMFVLDLTVGSINSTEIGPVTVAVASPADDELASFTIGTLSELDVPEVTIIPVTADAVDATVESGDATLGLSFPEGFTAALLGGDGPEVRVSQGISAGVESEIVVAVLDGVLARYAAGAEARTAGSTLRLADAEALLREVAAAPPSITLTAGQASNEQLSLTGTLVAGQTGLFMLYTVGIGVLSLIEERGRGTLARLRSMPMRPGVIVAAKALGSIIIGIVATAVLLLAGGRLFGVSFGAVVPVAVLVVSAVVAATAIMFVVIRLARTTEQAGVAQSILAFALGIAGGACFPLNASGVLGTLLDVNPVGAFIRGLGITAGGGGLGDIGVPISILVGFTVVSVVLTRLLPDRGATS